MRNELLRQVRVIDAVAETDSIADLFISGGRMQKILTPELETPPETTVTQGQGLVLGTGLVDLYSHSGEPGFEERETLASLAAAARAGGFTRVAILPDTKPAIDQCSTLRFIQNLESNLEKNLYLSSAQIPYPHFYYWGALTQKVQGEQMTELTELAAAGIVGFADGQPIANLALVRRLLEYLKPLGKPVALALGDRTLEVGGIMREGLDSLTFGLVGNPHISETAYLASLLEIIAAIATPVHIMGVSTRRSVELIAAAKAGGVPITASTTWMHLIHNTGDLASYDPSLQVQPPIGEPEDQQALITGIREGIIDSIAVNHTPYTYAEKTVAFSDAPPGAIGLELALPLLWQHLVTPGHLSPLQLWQSLSTKPAQCLHQTLNPMDPENLQEVILFDPQQVWQCNVSSLKSIATNTPWFDRSIQGKIVSYQ
ncbi:MAG: dihydroorotase [Coleofasciculaceae cyanobacterium SM2_1_6]|nr:dihydroorotase [Coleofasciculaceae cyanobacterium SM2_1_6]